MPPDLTNEDLKKLFETFQGQLPLQIGIADYKPYATTTHPSANSGLDFLDDFAQRFQGVQAQAGGNSPLGFITTPEYFLADKELPSGRYYTSIPTSHEDTRNELANISAKYPNIIFMPAGYYHHPLKSKEKLNQKIQNVNTFKATYPPLTPSRPIYDPLNRIGPGTQFMKYGVNDITEMYDPFAAENDPAPALGRPPISNAATVKNQNHYYWKGHKLGSYKKSSYFDELKKEALDTFPNQDLLYDIGNQQTKSLRGSAAPTMNQFISNLLSQNIHPEICFDRRCNIPIPSSKKMHLLQSENVTPPQNPLLPLAIYADTNSLMNYDPSTWRFNTPSPFWPVVRAHPSGSSSSSSTSAVTSSNVPLLAHYPSPNQLHHGFMFAPTTFP